jgi:hypothetical protein
MKKISLANAQPSDAPRYRVTANQVGASKSKPLLPLLVSTGQI